MYPIILSIAKGEYKCYIVGRLEYDKWSLLLKRQTL